MRALICCLTFAGAVHAQPYVEIGVGAAVGGCVEDGYTYTTNKAVVRPSIGPKPVTKVDVDVACSRNPLGVAALGYRTQPLSLPGAPRVEFRAEHWSSLQHHDRGVDLVSARPRWEFGK